MTEERRLERKKDFDNLPTIAQIVEQHPNEFNEGRQAKDGAKNPYEQSGHFDLTVNDAKHIAWREGNKKSELPLFDQFRSGTEAFLECCGIMFGYKSRQAANVAHGPENVRLFEERFHRAYAEVYPGLPVPKLFTKK